MTEMIPTIGWMCDEPSFFRAARALLDEDSETPSAKSADKYLYSQGHIGSTNVVIYQLPQAPPAERTDHQSVEELVGNLSHLEAILVTGVVDGTVSPKINDGDIVICSTITGSEGSTPSSTPSTVQLAVEIIKKEVGADGSWLTMSASSSTPSETLENVATVQTPSENIPRHPQLHYLNFDAPDGQTDAGILQGRLKGLKKAVAACAKTGRGKTSIPVVLILVVTRKFGIGGDNLQNEDLCSKTGLYAIELIKTSSETTPISSTILQGTEKILQTLADPEIPPFEPQQLPVYGNAFLLVIPTANQYKIRICKKYIEDRVTDDVAVHTVILPVESDVGEQPYNAAGVVGAHNRISNAMHRLQDEEYKAILRSKGIGTVILMAIENYIQFDGVQRPADYGVVVVHNASAQKSTGCFSCGVTVPPAFVDRARRFGYAGNPNYGRVTVGQILAAHVPGLDKADWHKLLAGRSRYDILEDAIGKLSFPR